jgi:hypothetical protein
MHNCISPGHNCINVVQKCIYLGHNCIKSGHNCIRLMHNCIELGHNCIKLMHNCIDLGHYCIRLMHNCIKLLFRFLGMRISVGAVREPPFCFCREGVAPWRAALNPGAARTPPLILNNSLLILNTFFSYPLTFSPSFFPCVSVSPVRE